MAAPKGNQYAKGAENSGHPDTYDLELCKDICERVTNGEHIKEVLDSDKKRYPRFQTWCNWKREHDELFDLYTRAIQDKAEMVTFEIYQTMQEVRNGTLGAAEARVIIDTLKWLASKFYPRMFGNKLDLTSDNKPLASAPPVTVMLDGQALQASNIKIVPPSESKG